MKKILTPYTKGNFSLKNHLVMAPMTRARATNNLPNDLIVEYYEQRGGAGLIVTEGVSPTPEGLGYTNIPGIFSEAQIAAWKKTTEAVHKHDAKIFMQFMHTGRIGHNANLPQGYKIIGASSIKAAGETYTYTEGMQSFSEPVALTKDGVEKLIDGFVMAAKNAIAAGFDGIELHGAHGYLLEQFLNPNINNRTDEFGGSIANRCKVIIEIAAKSALAIGKEKVGIRLSPSSTFNDMQAYSEEEVHETYSYLAAELNKLGIVYIHISANDAAPKKTYEAIRKNFTNTIIFCNGLTPETAELILAKGVYDLVGFGKAYLANPDLEKRIEKNAPLNQPDFKTLYAGAGKEGFTNYPTIEEQLNKS
ncbi:MAG TPA: alkene reductase [Bacteroidia bacterium]|nr:alkene reductase [Bacteroidia bacterium]